MELYSLSAHQKLGSLNTWTYNDVMQTFGNYVEAISVANERLYLANISSCIDVFDVHTESGTVTGGMETHSCFIHMQWLL